MNRKLKQKVIILGILLVLCIVSSLWNSRTGEAEFVTAPTESQTADGYEVKSEAKVVEDKVVEGKVVEGKVVEDEVAEDKKTAEDITLSEERRYSDYESVAAYLHEFGHLPSNFIKKNDAKDLGWDSKAGNLWEVTDQMSIGGDKFGNHEGKLPAEKGRQWYECDINYEGGHRGADRILYSNDGLIYYSDDHYNTFTQLY